MTNYWIAIILLASQTLNPNNNKLNMVKSGKEPMDDNNNVTNKLML